MFSWSHISNYNHYYWHFFQRAFSNFTELTFCFSITEFIFQYDSFMIAVSSSCFIEDSCRDLWLCIGKDRPKLSHEEEGVKTVCFRKFGGICVCAISQKSHDQAQNNNQKNSCKCMPCWRSTNYWPRLWLFTIAPLKHELSLRLAWKMGGSL